MKITMTYYAFLKVLGECRATDLKYPWMSVEKRLLEIADLMDDAVVLDLELLSSDNAPLN